MKKSATFLSIYSCAILNAATFYVSTTGKIDASGTSWENATNNLQSAIDACAESGGGEVWVERGTYAPTTIANENLSQNKRAVHFSLRNDVKVLGGFIKGAKDISERNFIANKTILSGDLNNNDTTNIESKYDNAYTLFFHPKSANLNNSAILDGFELRAGFAYYANDEYSSFMENMRGGAIHNAKSSPTIRNCVFTENNAADKGGAIYNFDSECVIENCVFEKNSSNSVGGAIANVSSRMRISECAFRQNSALLGGSVFCVENDATVFANCTFTENSSEFGGGAIFSYKKAYTTVKNCTFVDNQKNYTGGNSSDSTNATFSAVNSLFNGTGDVEILDRLDAKSTLNYCFTPTPHAGEGNISGDPKLGEYGIYGGTIPTIPVLNGSPLIGAGSNAEATDARGFARAVKSTIGAYEYLYGAQYEKWAFDNNLRGDNAKPDATPQFDSIKNLEKFAFGLDPTKATSYAENKYFSVTNNGAIATMRYPVNKYATDLEIKNYVSEDLINWTETDAETFEENGIFNIKKIEKTIPVGGKLFFKIEVTQREL